MALTQLAAQTLRAGEDLEVVTAYNATGLPDSITVNGFDPQGNAIQRVTTFLYNGNGQVTDIDGPRTDVSDITVLDYYNCTTGFECGQLKSITNAAGHTTTFDTYDHYGRLTQETAPNGLTANYTYIGQYGVSKKVVTLASGGTRTTDYLYNNVGLLERQITPDGVTLNFGYDGAHQLISVTDNLDNEISYDYDDNGNLTDEDIYDPADVLKRAVDSVYDARNRLDTINNGGFTTDVLFDAAGKLTDEVDPKLAATVHHYDDLNRLEQTVDALTGNTDYGYDVNDNITSITAPNGANTTYEYDDLGNLLKEVSPDRGQITYTYDTAGNQLTMLDARGKLTTYSYDVLNRLTQELLDGGQTITYVYDTATNGVGRLHKVLDSTGSTEWTYNSIGEVTQKDQTISGTLLSTIFTRNVNTGWLDSMTLPSGKVVSYGYTSHQQTSVTADGELILSNATYDPFGPANGWTWGNGTVVNRNYSLRGLLDSQSMVTDTRTLGYDAAGQVLTMVDATVDLDFDYDLLGRLTDYTDNNGGGTSSPMFTSTPIVLADIQTATNQAGGPNPTPWIMSTINNVTSSSVQLALGRAEVNTGSVTVPETIGYVVFENATGSFSANGGTVDYEAVTTADAVQGVDEGCHSTTFTNSFLAPPIVVATINRHDEDDGGWVRRCSPSNVTADFTIDEDQYLDNERSHTTEAVGYAAFSQSFDATFTDAVGTWGMEVGMTVLPTTISGSGFQHIPFQQTYGTVPIVIVLASNQTPEPAGIRINNVTTTGFDAVQMEPANSDGYQGQMQMHYLVIEAGAHELPDGTRILAGTVDTTKQQHGTGVVGTESWESVAFGDWPIGGGGSGSQIFTYDANGNRESFDDGTYYDYTNLASTNRLLSTAGPAAKTYTYDASGNVTGDGIHTYGYDDRGRLVDVDTGSVTYEHNGLGQRVLKDDGSTTTLYVYDEDGALLGEYSDTGAAIIEHIHFNGAPVGLIQGTDKKYVHTDHLGTPRAISEGNTVVWRWDSDPFGTTAAQEDPDGDLVFLTYNLRYPGQYFDSETGLYYNYFRTYDPSTGRYLESDLIGLVGGLNTFVYVDGSPTGNVDPLGLYSFPSLRNRYLQGQFRAMQQYIKYWLVTAGIVAPIAAVPLVAEAAICYAPAAVVTFSPILTNPAVQQGVIDYLSGYFVPGPPSSPIAALGMGTDLVIDAAIDLAKKPDQSDTEDCGCEK